MIVTVFTKKLTLIEMNTISILLRANSFLEGFIIATIKVMLFSFLLYVASGIYRYLFNKNKKNNNTVAKTEQLESSNILEKSGTSELKRKNKVFFINRISEGYKRLTLVGGFIFSILFSIFFYSSSADLGAVVAVFICGLLIYGLIVFVCLWVYDGFKGDGRREF